MLALTGTWSGSAVGKQELQVEWTLFPKPEPKSITAEIRWQLLPEARKLIFLTNWRGEDLQDTQCEDFPS